MKISKFLSFSIYSGIALLAALMAFEYVNKENAVLKQNTHGITQVRLPQIHDDQLHNILSENGTTLYNGWAQKASKHFYINHEDAKAEVFG